MVNLMVHTYNDKKKLFIAVSLVLCGYSNGNVLLLQEVLQPTAAATAFDTIANCHKTNTCV